MNQLVAMLADMIMQVNGQRTKKPLHYWDMMQIERCITEGNRALHSANYPRMQIAYRDLKELL